MDFKFKEELSPKEIAIKLFSNEPKEPCSIFIYSDDADLELIFQILVTVLMEGIFTIYSESKLNLKNFDNTISNLKPFLDTYINSLGFSFNMKTYDLEDSKNYDGYYCIIKLKDNYPLEFELAKNKENYTFSINPKIRNYLSIMKEINMFHAIFYNEGKVYSFYFDKFVRQFSNLTDFKEKNMK